MMSIALILIVVLVGGGTSLAAQVALPGDLLYPVKVGLNEKVGASLRLSTAAQADYEAKLAERRLEEAVGLAAEASVSPAVWAGIESNFTAHAERTRTRIAELESKGQVTAAADLASRFESALEAHERVLAQLEGVVTSSSTIQGMADVRNSVRAELAATHATRIALETAIMTSSSTTPEVKSAAEGKVKAATQVIAAAEQFIAQKKASLGASSTIEAEARIQAAANLVTQAETKIQAEAYGEAFTLGNAAIRGAQEARALIDLGGHSSTSVQTSSSGQAHTTGTVQATGSLKVKTGSSTSGEAGLHLQLGL